MEELILALKIIKDECLKYKMCDVCTIYNKEIGCLIKDLPCDWEISAIEDSLKGSD